MRRQAKAKSVLTEEESQLAQVRRYRDTYRVVMHYPLTLLLFSVTDQPNIKIP